MPAESYAQGVYDIVGLVLDSATQKPVAKVTVSIARTSIKTITDVDGSFNIRYVKQGKYRLTFAHEKYDSAVAQIDLNKNLRQTFFIHKTPPPPPPPQPAIDSAARDSLLKALEAGGKKKKRKEKKPNDAKYGELSAPSDSAIQDLIAYMVDYREIYIDEIKWDKKEKYWEATGFLIVEDLGLYEFEAEILPKNDGGLILQEFEAKRAKAKKDKK